MDQKSVQNRSKMEIKKRIQMWSQFCRKHGPRKKSLAGNAAAPESLFKALECPKITHALRQGAADCKRFAMPAPTQKFAQEYPAVDQVRG